MSKQSEAKERQGYVAKPILRTCVNCERMTFDMELPAWMRRANADLEALGERPRYGDWLKEKTNFRCGIGGFAVKKGGTCDEFAFKKE